jgi:hypothetical protein
MPAKTTTRTTRKASTPKRPKLVNDGKPKGKGKGGTVTRHGVTTTGYQRGCRCKECVAAAVAYKRKARERKREAAQAAEQVNAEKAAKRRAAKKANGGS